ncbi:alpha/beta hydrolase fold domain-containing protein [Deinococcus sp. PESE-13]
MADAPQWKGGYARRVLPAASEHSHWPPPDLELLTDVPFSTHGLALDVLRPRARATEPVPAILHFHGGGWVKFGKWPVANTFLARAGFVTVSADYRLAPGATFPAQLHDVKTAVRFVRAHAAELGIDPQRIGAWGVSAGAHLAALLGTVSGEEGPDGGWSDGGWPGESSAVQAVGSVCGPLDFFDPAWNFGPEPFELLGGPFHERLALARAASPLEHVTPDAPPFCLLHGIADDEVPVSQSRRMHAVLQLMEGRAAGVLSELTELDGGHYINDTHQAEVEARLLAFFQRTLSFSPCC